MQSPIKFMSAKEVSNLGVPYGVVLEACQRGELSAQRLGPAFAIEEANGRAFVEAYKSRHDPHNVSAMQSRIRYLENQVRELGGVV